MKLKLILLSAFVLISSLPLISQDTNSVSYSRKENLKKQLNYRYKGGYYSFEKKFNNMVTYPEGARMNCITGIVVVAMIVDCEGVPVSLKMKTALGYGTNEEVSKFFQSTAGEWNKCTDDKYTRFEVPIQFYIEGTETNRDDALLVCEAEMPGHACNGDDFYRKKVEKALKSGNGKKALKYLKILFTRDPYNVEYAEMKEQAYEMANKKK